MSMRVRVDYRACEKCGGRRKLDPGHQALVNICRDLVAEKKPINAANVWPRWRDQPRHKWPLSRRRPDAIDRHTPPSSLHNMLADLVRMGLLTRRAKLVRIGRGHVVFYDLARSR